MQLKNIPLMDLEPDPKNPRGRITDKNTADLAASIAEIGLLQPLLVKPTATAMFVVVAGHRRLQAALKVKLNSVPCLVTNEQNDDRLAASQFAENVQREDMDLLSEAGAIKQLVETTPAPGAPATPIAEHMAILRVIGVRIGKTPAWVRTRLAINDFPAAVKQLIRNELIGPRACKFLSNLPKPILTDLGRRLKHFEPTDDLDLIRFIREEILLMLSVAPWGLTGELAGKIACDGCPENTATNKTLFGEDIERARCLNPRCWGAKWGATKLAALEGRTLLKANQFEFGEPKDKNLVDLARLSVADSDHNYSKTWRKLLGKKLLEKLPQFVAVNDQLFTIQIFVNRIAATAAARADGAEWATRSAVDPADALARRNKRIQNEYESNTLLAVSEHSGPTTLTDVRVLRSMAKYLGDRMTALGAQRFCKRHELGLSKQKAAAATGYAIWNQALEKHIAQADPTVLPGLILELTYGRDFVDEKALKALATSLDVDTKALSKAARDKFAQPKAAPKRKAKVKK